LYAQLIFLKKLDKKLCALAQDAKDRQAQHDKKQEEPFTWVTLTNMFKPTQEPPCNRFEEEDCGPLVFDEDYLYQILEGTDDDAKGSALTQILSGTPYGQSPRGSQHGDNPSDLIMTHFLGDVWEEDP